ARVVGAAGHCPRRPVARGAKVAVDGSAPGVAGQGQPSDLVPEALREPEVPVRPGVDSAGPAGSGWDGAELGDGAVGRDSPDLVPVLFGEPQIAVDPRRDRPRLAAGG